MAFGTGSTVVLIILSLLLLIIFGINIYVSRQQSQRAQQLILTGSTSIQDYSNWIFGLNIAGIALLVIMMSIFVYQWFQARKFNVDLVSPTPIPVSVTSPPRFTPGVSKTVVTEIQDE